MIKLLKRTLLILSLSALNLSMLGIAFAQDYLEPCANVLDEYRARVKEIARSEIPGNLELWVGVYPSFLPEWSVGVSNENGRYYVTYVSFDQSLWHSSWVDTGPRTMVNDPSKGTANPTAKTSRISSRLFDMLYDEWEKSIGAVSPPDSIGLDGVSYNFELDGQCARAWSPRSNSRNRKLVELIESLVEFAEIEDSRTSPRNEQIVIGKLRAIPELQ